MQSPEVRVQSIMSTDLVTVLPITPVIEVSRLMLQKHIRCILICDDNGALKGIVTDSDLVFSVAGKAGETLQTPISEIMTKDPIVVDPSMDIYDAVTIMSEKGFRRVPVVKDGRAVGIVSIRDIVRNILEDLQDRSNAQ